MATRFRSAAYRELAKLAISQGFIESTRGSGHKGYRCPECGGLVILSTTQNDAAIGSKYRNSVALFRNHGLRIAGRVTKGCQNARTE